MEKMTLKHEGTTTISTERYSWMYDTILELQSSLDVSKDIAMDRAERIKILEEALVAKSLDNLLLCASYDLYLHHNDQIISELEDVYLVPHKTVEKVIRATYEGAHQNDTQEV